MSLGDQSPDNDKPSFPGTATLVLRSSTAKDRSVPRPHPSRPKNPERKRSAQSSERSLSTQSTRTTGTPGRLLLVPDPTSPELSLALRWRSWSELVCPGEAHPYLVGEYLEQMPQLLGNAPGVDASIKCAFTSSLAVLNRHCPDNYVDACALAVRAVSAMRATASTALQNSMLATYTLLALALLNLAEVRRPLLSAP
jgi:hypothetical protein